jgi:hypothetical protein
MSETHSERKAEKRKARHLRICSRQEPKKKQKKTPTFKCENKRENPNFATKASLLRKNSGDPKN